MHYRTCAHVVGFQKMEYLFASGYVLESWLLGLLHFNYVTKKCPVHWTLTMFIPGIETGSDSVATVPEWQQNCNIFILVYMMEFAHVFKHISVIEIHTTPPRAPSLLQWTNQRETHTLIYGADCPQGHKFELSCAALDHSTCGTISHAAGDICCNGAKRSKNCICCTSSVSHIRYNCHANDFCCTRHACGTRCICCTKRICSIRCIWTSRGACIARGSRHICGSICTNGACDISITRSNSSICGANGTWDTWGVCVARRACFTRDVCGTRSARSFVPATTRFHFWGDLYQSIWSRFCEHNKQSIWCHFLYQCGVIWKQYCYIFSDCSSSFTLKLNCLFNVT